jgi:hypothetical protein
VHAYDASAWGAPVLRLLERKERLHAVSFDLTQVIDHAHLVVLAVALVKTLQPMAREITTFKAEFYSLVQQGRTLALDKGAFLVTGTTASAVGDLASLLGDIVRPGQVATADAAVHSTWGNQVSMHA